MSVSYDDFTESLELANSLISIEKDHYSNPPKHNERKFVQGLRGGAAVLMVAAFEHFLHDCMEENLTRLTKTPPLVDFNKLPEKMRIQSIFKTLERAMKGPPFQPSKPKKDRLVDIESACRIVVSSNINPNMFSETGSNPNSDTVSEMFSSIGISDVFNIIKSKFEKKWGQTVSSTFIRDKLDEIVIRRHVVAHTASALNISRTDLNSSVKFLQVLSQVLYKELNSHIESLLTSAAL